MAPTIGMMTSSDEGSNYLAERSANNHADGEIHDIAFGNEFLKFLQHGKLLGKAGLFRFLPAGRADHSKYAAVQNDR